MYRGQRFVFLVGLCTLGAGGVSAQTLTEEDVLARMRARHPHVRVLDLTVREFEADTRERGLLTNPAVTYSRESTGFGVDEFILVTQELPLRGRLSLLDDAGRQAVIAAQERADGDLLMLETQLRIVFTDLLLAQERIGVFEEALSELNHLVDLLRLRERDGESSAFDRLSAEREVAEIEADREAGTIKRLRAQAKLASFFGPGSDPDRLEAAGRLTNRSVLPRLEVLLAEVWSRRSDYRALKLERERWDTERRAAERLRFGKLN